MSTDGMEMVVDQNDKLGSNGRLEEYTYKDKKKLRYGYTTGSCSAAAAKAAAIMLLSGSRIHKTSLITPKGIPLSLPIHNIENGHDNQGFLWVSCSVKKDSGDDPDVTDGLDIYAKVTLNDSQGIQIDGGIGVGRVTKPGLEIPVGMAAINRVPRQMIEAETAEICELYDYKKGLNIEIFVPDGVNISKKTFNERLGIMGGISILGTSGIVEPMSDAALIDSIKAEINILRAEGRDTIIVTLGNYGEDFLRRYHGNTIDNNLKADINVNGHKQGSEHNLNLSSSLKCSNFIGDTIDYAAVAGIKRIILIGHAGKLVKVAGGILNTHSRYGDCRMEILAAHGAAAGVSQYKIKQVLNAVTTDEAFALLMEEKSYPDIISSLLHKVDFYLCQRAGEGLKIGALLFSNRFGVIGATNNINSLLEEYKKQKINHS